MRLLFDVTHPALVHLFRHAIDELDGRGHDLLVTSRGKDVTLELLDAYDIPHVPVSRTRGSPVALAAEWAAREVRMARLARSFDPDVIVSQISPAAAHAAGLIGASCVLFTDSEAARFATRITRPFADAILTPAGFATDLGPAHRRYDGFHELAYLHPERFDSDPASLEAAGVDVTEPYSVVRFVSWKAHHDVGRRGFSRAAKRDLLRRLSEHGAVYLTCEGPLPDEFEEYRLPVAPEDVHDLLAYADLYVGDSQTMATEAALLGTPSVRSNSFAGADDMSNFRELEAEYGLLVSTADERVAVDRAVELLADPESADRWDRRRERLLADKVDVTDVVVDTVLAEGAAGSDGMGDADGADAVGGAERVESVEGVA